VDRVSLLERLLVPLIPRNARQINTIHHPLSTVHAFPALAALALAAGCADLSWHKEGASAATLEQDLAECRGEARINAGPDARFLRPDAGRIVGLDAAGRPAPGSSGALNTDRFLAEHDLTRICMQRKGYELVPVRKR
jgi:hypothetical protein